MRRVNAVNDRVAIEVPDIGNDDGTSKNEMAVVPGIL